MRRILLTLTLFLVVVTGKFDWEEIREICGVSNSDRIIGGTATKIGQFPWIAHIGILRREGKNATLR